MNFPPPSPKQAQLIWAALTGLAAAVLVALIVALLWGTGRVLHELSPVIWPLAIAAVIAYLLDPVVDFLQRKGAPRPRAILFVFTMALLIIVGLAGSVVPQLVVETRDLSQKLPTYTKQLKQKAEDLATNPPKWVRKYILPPRAPAAETPSAGTNVQTAPVVDESTIHLAPISAPAPAKAPPAGSEPANLKSVTDLIEKVLPTVSQWLSQAVSIVAWWFGVLAGLALVPIYAFYLLLEKRGIESKWTHYLPLADSSFKTELVFVLRSINDYLITFFRGQVLVAICDGILYTLGFLIIGLPYASLIGVMATFLTIIPFLGAITTCVVALVVALVASGNWHQPALVLAVFAVVQTLEGFVIQPKIIGDRVGLHPLTIIIALMVGTTLLGGILGGILAIPLTAALRVIMFRYVWKQRKT
jgi:predicted PurR-regulated permease PerM